MAVKGWMGSTNSRTKWERCALGSAAALAVAMLAMPAWVRASDSATTETGAAAFTLLPEATPSDSAADASAPDMASGQLFALDNTQSGATATTQNTPTGSNYANTPTIGETKRETPVTPAAPEIVAASPEKPNIHGFFNSSFKTAYVTPRGLVVQNEGLVWQPIVGLVIPLGDIGVLQDVAIDGGIWNSVDFAEAGTYNTGAWDEMDPFFGVSGKVAKVVSLALGYTVFNSPQQAYRSEHNLDLKISYDDSKMPVWGNSGFSLNPYIDCWWAISGSSTVTLGQAGATGYFEPGIVPSYTVKAIENYPITLTFPTYVSIGPRSYWATHGEPGGNFGLFSCSINGTVPLAFIPSKYGFWHGDIGFTYDYLINQTLLHAGEVVSGNTNHNVIVGSLGFGVNF